MGRCRLGFMHSVLFVTPLAGSFLSLLMVSDDCTGDFFHPGLYQQPQRHVGLRRGAVSYWPRTVHQHRC